MFLFGRKRDELFIRLIALEEKINMLLNLYGSMERLETQNKELFDRLMARNWEQWANSPAVGQMDFGNEKNERVLSPTNDESNIGGILSDEELGK